ncbi:PQQ-binding-like beta-propeller repeat protein [Aquihabitans sp. G128]|uniref:outer membrane protein assembly factor BamB family protein n=1 Tax=Aquihabitans sp. G128 TaxID=2849779 RepID=UPI001C21A11D|nr:PQQ-binding-like beta-propeller repeat protein [Aquihabitans sp. G128]QXC59406.1 PQQ-binding-like beta-propeller repeat protein [Aquihabitans sp. G128]
MGGRRWWGQAVAAAAVVAVVAAGLVAFTTTGDLSVRPTSADPRVARQLALTSLWDTSTRTTPEGTAWLSTAAQVGTTINAGPSTSRGFRLALDRLLGDAERTLADARLVRRYLVTREADGTTSEEVAVLAASAKGMFLLGFEGTDHIDLYLDPPLKLLSADARPGDRWSGKGSWGATTYEHRTSITAAGPTTTVAGRRTDCIRVHSRYRIGEEGPVDSDEVRCPGLGSVREVTDDARVEQVAAPGFRATARAPGAAGRAGAAPVPGGDPVGWVLEPVAQLTDQYGSRPQVPPAVVGGERPLVVAADGRTRTLQAFATSTDGRPLWRAGLGALPRGRIGVDPEDGTTYVGTPDRRAYAFTREGLLRWVAQTGDNVAAAPARVGRVVVVAGEDGRIRAFDHATGAPRWKVDVGTPAVADPAVLGDDVVVADDDGVVRRLAGRTGAERWKVDVGSAVVDAPLAVRGDVVVSSTDGSVTRLDGASGSTDWTAQQVDQAVGGRSPAAAPWSPWTPAGGSRPTTSPTVPAPIGARASARWARRWRPRVGWWSLCARAGCCSSTAAARPCGGGRRRLANPLGWGSPAR